MYTMFQPFRRIAFHYAGVLGAACILLASACKKDEPDHHLCGPWEYEGEFGPEHWGELSDPCEEYVHCNGMAQSPIAIDGAILDNNLAALDLHYTTTNTHIIHKGHTIEFEVEEGNVLKLGGKEYELSQFHFHAQSEHTLMGVPYHMEAHFVHANELGDRAVISVMFKDGAENAFLAQVIGNLPNPGAAPYISATRFNPSVLFPTTPSADYFTYPGSLTTPNCEENVTWFIYQHPVEASTAQILRFRDLMPRNNRPQAPLNGRLIRATSL